MAVVKANYVKRGAGERSTAKANIRYIQERPGRDKEKLTRVLFGSAGIMGRHEAYQFIDEEAKKVSFFYRLKLSPDPLREDIKRDLNMQKLTRQMMRSLENRLNTAIPWAAALHDDHSSLRHVHILAAIPRRLQKYELEFLIRQATQACLEQRRGLDIGETLTLWQQNKQQRLGYQTGKNRPTHHTTARDQTSYHLLRGTRAAQPYSSCTCPRCHLPQSHNRHAGIHQCASCGLMLHKKRQHSLQQRKGRGLERSL